MTARAHIGLEKKLASALLALGDIPYAEAKLMTASQVCSLYAFDHYPVRHEDGGPDEPWNLVPRLIAAHRRKTAKIDRPQSAKGARLRESLAAFNSRISAKVTGMAAADAKSRWPQGRKMKSGNTFQRRNGRT